MINGDGVFYRITYVGDSGANRLVKAEIDQGYTDTYFWWLCGQDTGIVIRSGSSESKDIPTSFTWHYPGRVGDVVV